LTTSGGREKNLYRGAQLQIIPYKKPQNIFKNLVNDRYRYLVSDIGDNSKDEDIGLSVSTADLKDNYCTLLPGTNQLVITQAFCHYTKLPMHGVQNCGSSCKWGVG